MGFPMRKLICLFSIFIAACGGGGSNTTGSTVIVTTPSVTTVPTVATVSTVSLPSCSLKLYDASYPNSYLGSRLLPTPNQSFDSVVMRSIGLKDYYPWDNNNCNSVSDYTRLLYQKTLDRLQTLNVDTVEIYQAGSVDDITASTWVVNENNWQIPKSELIWFFQEAHRRNLKVTLVWQLLPSDNKGHQINTTNPSEQEMIKVLRGWHNIIMEMAKLGAANKVDNLLIQWSAFYYPAVSTYSETATQEYLSIVNDIRSVFNGKLFMGIVGGMFFDKRLINKVDAVVIPLTPSNWSYIDDLNMSVPLLKQRYIDSISGLYLTFALNSGMNVTDIPIIWDFNIQSRDKALSQGWVEDGFCIASLNGTPSSWGSPSCAQQINYVTDFSVQALAIEGAFQAIKTQKYFKTYGINFSTGYWHTDTLTPGPEGFPNYSQSLRGKPAENIVKAWFQK